MALWALLVSRQKECYTVLFLQFFQAADIKRRSVSDTFGTRNAGQALEELVKTQAISVDLREAVMACLSGGESRRWTVGELVERFKNLGVCASRASRRRWPNWGSSLSSRAGRRGACLNEGPNGSWRLRLHLLLPCGVAVFFVGDEERSVVFGVEQAVVLPAAIRVSRLRPGQRRIG